jgi:capsular exopolysaccharide synthesis family protein
LVIALALVLLLERLNRRIREPEELEAIYRLPLLGTVPKSAALARAGRERGGKRVPLPPEEAERFSLIRARLRFFNVDRQLRTIVVASAEPGDGKTLVARHLAEAAARLGSRVLLLETDLRHPTLAEQLGVQPRPGLADVLIGAVAMDQAVASIPLDGASADGAGARGMDLLTAGAVLPPNPSELLESRAIDAVLERARLTYDLVVIDTPPLTAVSDAFPLLAKVDGIVLVGRVGRSHRHAAERLRQDLESSGAPLLGVVANGSDDGGPGVYAYTRDGKQQAAAPSSNGAVPAEELAPTARS